MEKHEATPDPGSTPEEGSAAPAAESHAADARPGEGDARETQSPPRTGEDRGPGGWDWAGSSDAGSARTGAAMGETPGEDEPVREPSAQPGVGPRIALVAAVSGGVLLFALAFFMAGFWVHDMVDDEGSASAAEVSNNNAADDPFWGPEDATVTIEEFADFQCPYCGSFTNETLPRLREEYGDKVKFIYRDFPLSNIHPYAQKAAEAGQCAHDQGEFWSYHDLLYNNPDDLEDNDLERYAEEVGLDLDEFGECLDSGEHGWEVLLDQRDGAEVGVSGTPAFLINGVLISGAQPYEKFEAIIERALRSGG